MTMTQTEEFLIESVQRVERLLAEKQRQLDESRQLVATLDSVISKASKIATHIPFLCREMPEVSAELEQAALQLQQILVQRQG